MLSITMEDRLSFVFIISLKEITLRSVVFNLWNEPDTLALIELFYSDYRKKHGVYSDEWRQIVESKVIDKISKLEFPEKLKTQLLLIVTPIGLQIQRWLHFYNSCVKYLTLSDPPTAHILSKLCWTTAGTIDYQKTAEKLIQCEMLNIVKRYVLACRCCLEEYIAVFWEELPEEKKRYYYNRDDVVHGYELFLECYWPFILNGEQSKLDKRFRLKLSYFKFSFNQFAFYSSAQNGNKAAAKYFFQKLTQEEKEGCLMLTTKNTALLHSLEISNDTLNYLSDRSSDVLCYLMSKMNHEEQMKLLKKYPRNVLYCFLLWPWHDLFLKIADLISHFISAVDTKFLLFSMSLHISISEYYFPILFREFFVRSPIKFKKLFIEQQFLSRDIFPVSFYLQDSETVKIIFRNVDPADRVRIVSSEHLFRLFCDYFLKGSWHLVEVCLREATLSNKDREELKEAFIGFLRTDKGQIQKNGLEQTEDRPVWKRFLQSLDEIYGSSLDKRCLEDETLNKAKKLCFYE